VEKVVCFISGHFYRCSKYNF